MKAIGRSLWFGINATDAEVGRKQMRRTPGELQWPALFGRVSGSYRGGASVASLHCPWKLVPYCLGLPVFHLALDEQRPPSPAWRTKVGKQSLVPSSRRAILPHHPKRCPA